MMAGINFEGGILTFIGTDAHDYAEIGVFEANNSFHVTATLAGDISVIDNELVVAEFYAAEAPIETISRIVFNAGAGDDSLIVDVDFPLTVLFAIEGTVLEFNGEAGNDTLVNSDPLGGIETVANGGPDNDRLEGSRYNDIFDGGLGNDIMTGSGGNDTYKFDGRNLGTDEIREDANVDTDTLDFSNFESFVSVDLEEVYNSSNPDFAVKAFMSNLKVKLSDATGIEDVIGSPSTDTIRGNSRPNHFWGGGEDDKLEGRGGDDVLEGETGSDLYEFGGTNLGTDDIIEAANSDNDLLRFGGMTTGLTIDISKSGSEFAVNSANLRLRLSNNTAIERVFGTHYGDSITGNSRNNVLKGLGGADAIQGLGGADTLEGGADNDVLYTDALDVAYGGLGRDFFDGFTEDPARPNPRRTRYIDWGTV
jgi:Ca2+-binding RTX toxin-like protein